MVFAGNEIVDECIWEDAIPFGKPVVTEVDIDMAVDLSGEVPGYRLTYTRVAPPDLSSWHGDVFGPFPPCQANGA